MAIEIDPEFRVRVEGLLDNAACTEAIRSVIKKLLAYCDNHECEAVLLTEEDGA